MDRREILATGAVLAAAYAVCRVAPALFDARIEFVPLSEPRGFRRIAGGSVSTGFAAFVGLEPIRTLSPLGGPDFCGALFFGPSHADESVVRVASFSDFYCPYCRVQTKRLARIEGESNGRVSVMWHELPLLGDNSDPAAGAALAARRQNAYAAFQERMMTPSFQATPAYLTALSTQIGLDYGQLEADMAGNEVDFDLHVSAALARRFVFVGTPGLVIGKTTVMGEISERVMQKLIEIEGEEGLGNLCTT